MRSILPDFYSTCHRAPSLATRALLCLLIVGCGGDALQRTVVSGTVTYRGEPVEDGQIRFVPQGSTEGPLTIDPIKNGRYRCDRAGGVPVGTHRVEILAFDPKDPEPSGPGQRPRRQLIPARYNKRSELVVVITSDENTTTENFPLAD